MLANTTNTNEITSTKYIHDGYLVDEIDCIDLSHLEFDDNDNWLYIPPRCSTESIIQDLYTWLKTSPESDIRNNKKYVDTRTFTRSKKRTTRMNFESIFEGLPPYVTSIWKQNLEAACTKDEKSLPISAEDKESIPSMLKPSAKTAMNILSSENLLKSGQESMEAFLNMSQSKGIDSFINLGEPEFSDVLMNVSQPSVLCMSITSTTNESTFKMDDVSSIMNKDTMTQHVHQCINVEGNSSFDSINETFVIPGNDDGTIVTPNKTYCASSMNNTFCKGPIQSNRNLNGTFNTVASGKTAALSTSLNKRKTDAVTLSSTFLTESNDNLAQMEKGEVNNDVKPLNITYTEYQSLATYAKGQNTTVSIGTDASKLAAPVHKADLNAACNIPFNRTNKSAALLDTYAENVSDIFFEVPMCGQSTPIQSSSTSKFVANHSDQPRQIMYSTLKAPTSLRRELLAEIRRSGERKLDATYHVPDDYFASRNTKENIQVSRDENIKSEADVFPLQNKYYTYRKPTVTTANCKSQCDQRNTIITVPQKESIVERKFYTFTKKSNNSEKMNKNIEESAETVRSDIDGTFCKPLPKVPKRNVPKTFSKLPQFLQKSNPNLISTLTRTTTGLPGSTNISSVGHIKGSQPNIAQNTGKTLPSKLHPFGKLKSGSEQRLIVDVNNASGFSIKTATGSTESIESTQSAHSAPDLDDGLSTCSDNSHNSCNRRTMNIEQLHQLVRMQEESLKQDSLIKPNRQILENTWVEVGTNLPSPILKNGEIDTRNVDLGMKCSSPLSPTGSSHTLNNEGTSESNVMKIEDKTVVVETTEGSNRVVPKIENKTRLRQPINWNTGNKPSAVISGIPRPASRIPALRFARPNAKTTQADLKKGYI